MRRNTEDWAVELQETGSVGLSPGCCRCDGAHDVPALAGAETGDAIRDKRHSCYESLERAPERSSVAKMWSRKVTLHALHE